MNPHDKVKQLQLTFFEFWAMRNARERAMLTAAALVTVAGLIYALLFQPALTGRQHLTKDMPALRQQIAQIQELSKEAGALSARTVPMAAPPSRESIEAALTRRSLKPKNVALNGDIVKVQLDAVSFSGTVTWLDEMQKTMQLSVIDANITVLPGADMVNATLSLRQRKNE